VQAAGWVAREKPGRNAPEAMLQDAAVARARTAIHRIFHTPGKALARVLAWPAYALLTRAGIHPLSLDAALRFGRPGGVIRRHRRFTGAG
jgi:hypothetical protein